MPRMQRGSSALEVAILLPLIVLIVVGGFEVWKLMLLKRALYIGTYQAARYLASHPQAHHMSIQERKEHATRFIMHELRGLRFYSSEMTLLADALRITLGKECPEANPKYLCGGRLVTVEAILRVPLRILRLPFEYPGLYIDLRGQCRDDPCRECY